MLRCRRSLLKQTFIILSCVSLHAAAREPVVKVDLNMSGRSLSEVNEPGYMLCAITNEGLVSLKEDRGPFVFKRYGSAGKNVYLKMVSPYSTHQITINNKGIYMLKIEEKESRRLAYSGKIIIQ